MWILLKTALRMSLSRHSVTESETSHHHCTAHASGERKQLRFFMSLFFFPCTSKKSTTFMFHFWSIAIVEQPLKYLGIFETKSWTTLKFLTSSSRGYPGSQADSCDKVYFLIFKRNKCLKKGDRLNVFKFFKSVKIIFWNQPFVQTQII